MSFFKESERWPIQGFGKETMTKGENFHAGQLQSINYMKYGRYEKEETLHSVKEKSFWTIMRSDRKPHKSYG
jgi:hypothetical protein